MASTSAWLGARRQLIEQLARPRMRRGGVTWVRSTRHGFAKTPRRLIASRLRVTTFYSAANRPTCERRLQRPVSTSHARDVVFLTGPQRALRRLSAGAAAGVCAPRLRGGPPITARSPAGQPPGRYRASEAGCLARCTSRFERNVILDADEHAAQTVVGDVSWLGGHEIERCGF
jgi:hypothetical protein